ncbi:hypothetical protein BU16DRAFT_23276 [Lophium mytilinum]|uniref:Uncharacterized protein n=1 Tax=Lophium mytilinum TaxID=390894 RepID=A0A6A6REY8_9PEZI|nr:hypothetical protein BU16DRAFT_23276 [Lophium mytilinum]
MASREDTVKLVHRAINASIFERVQELLRRICTESDFALDFVSGDILATESDVYKSDSSAEEDESGRGSESDSENNEGEKDEGHDVKPAEDIEDEPARKRKWTNYVHMCYPTCEQCNGEFDVTDNSRDSESVCRWHDGMKQSLLCVRPRLPTYDNARDRRKQSRLAC